MYRADRRQRRLGWLLNPFSACIVAVVVAMAGVGTYVATHKPSPIPKEIGEQAVFPLYYPTKLPKTYQIDQSSFKYADRRVSYTLTSPSQPKILVTIQPKPASYDLSNFTDNLPGKIGVLTPYGTATLGVAGSSKLSSLVKDDVWVLITSSSKVSDQNLKLITESLKQSSK